MKPPVVLTEPIDEMAPLLLEGLPFDPEMEFTAMGFQRKKSYPNHRPKIRDGRSNIKRDIAKER